MTDIATTTQAPLRPWTLPVEQVLQEIGSDARQGLTSEEAEKRLQHYGPNAIPEPEPDPLWRRYWGQLTGDAVVRLLLVGGVVSLLLGDVLEGVAIFIMLNIMAGFGLWQEGRAADAAKALRSADMPLKLVVRDGKRIEVPVTDIVPGDIIYLPTGAIAPADGRVVAAVNAEKDTSKLTGESLPVVIELDPLSEKTVVNEQKNMLHRGDAVVGGNATMVVTATGGQTEIGKIAARLSESEEVKTPLDEQLDQLGDAMTKIFIWIAAIVIGFGVVREFVSPSEPLNVGRVLEIFKEAFINAVALIIAAIPEGLPAVLTITLAIATGIMVKRNALIRKPKAVEGSGSMNVLLTDKTGTLTTNQMQVTTLYVNGQIFEVANLDGQATQQDEAMVRIARIATLCNNDSNSTDSALLRWARELSIEVVGGIEETRVTEHEFNQTLKRMTTVHRKPDEAHVAVLTKGAPEQVVALCSHFWMHGKVMEMDTVQRRFIQQAIEELAGRGLRVIALADRMSPEEEARSRDQAESKLVFIGMVGIMDPPRDDVAPAVEKLKAAGIRTIMVTGDNPITAYEVARMVRIVEPGMPFGEVVITGEELGELSDPSPELLERLQKVRIFARVTPQHKADIVRDMREAGFIVGMTGDGVNDAIALKESDVGLAMGNGTDVAREASEIVLMDSRFGTIPNAVEEGRNVLHRIRLYLSYILSGNGCEVGAFIVAYALGVPIPLTALVLLVINFATDSFPALAMAFEAGEKDVMQRPPRRRGEPFIGRTMWIHIGVQTVVATAIIMGVYAYCLNGVGASLEMARAAAFMTYIFQKLYRAFTARSMTSNIWEIGLFRNRWTLGAVAISMSIALFFVYMPVVNEAVGMTTLSLSFFPLMMVVGLLAPLAEELTKLYLKREKQQTGGEEPAGVPSMT
ncbi:MAG: cation-transporting P-type ATPase [Chloroflexaceae bacterium]|nr:cation-transporting P-type ATPase [Chloroflexaceae bacterium]